MHLGVEAAQKRNVPVAAQATLSWDATALPEHVSIELRDTQTGQRYELSGQGEFTFTTSPAEPIERAQGEATPSYRVRGDARFELQVTYSGTATGTLDGEGGDTGADPSTRYLPSALTLGQNYPNPFNPSTQIRFGLPSAAQGVRLSVHDMLGRRVATLLDGASLPAGWHEVTFNADHLPTGRYVYRLEVGIGTSATDQWQLARSLTLIK